MRISQKRHSDLYKSISDPIMDLRFKLVMNKDTTTEELDKHLFDLEIEIYKRIVSVLDLTKTQ